MVSCDRNNVKIAITIHFSVKTQKFNACVARCAFESLSPSQSTLINLWRNIHVFLYQMFIKI